MVAVVNSQGEVNLGATVELLGVFSENLGRRVGPFCGAVQRCRDQNRPGCEGRIDGDAIESAPTGGLRGGIDGIVSVLSDAEVEPRSRVVPVEVHSLDRKSTR